MKTSGGVNSLIFPEFLSIKAILCCVYCAPSLMTGLLGSSGGVWEHRSEMVRASGDHRTALRSPPNEAKGLLCVLSAATILSSIRSGEAVSAKKANSLLSGDHAIPNWFLLPGTSSLLGFAPCASAI